MGAGGAKGTGRTGVDDGRPSQGLLAQYRGPTVVRCCRIVLLLGRRIRESEGGLVDADGASWRLLGLGGGERKLAYGLRVPLYLHGTITYIQRYTFDQDGCDEGRE